VIEKRVKKRSFFLKCLLKVARPALDGRGKIFYLRARKRVFDENGRSQRRPLGSGKCHFWPKRQAKKWSKFSARDRGRMGA
jgi:hypothetical protein